MLFGSPEIIQHAPWLFYILKFFSLNAPGQLSPSFHIVSNTAFIVGFSTLPRSLTTVSAFIGLEHWNFQFFAAFAVTLIILSAPF
jgi:hypothetical protein